MLAPEAIEFAPPVVKEMGNTPNGPPREDEREAVMKRHAIWSIGLAALFALGLAQAKDDKPACSNHGTTIDFLDTPAEAAKEAKKQEKLVFVLHVSGNFEDPRFT